MCARGRDERLRGYRHACIDIHANYPINTLSSNDLSDVLARGVTMAEEQSAEDVLAELDALIASAGPDADPELVATADALRMSLSRDDEDNGEISGAKRKRADEDRDEDRDKDAAVSRAPDGDRMHPRNAFRDANPDFGALAARQPALKPHLIPCGKGRFRLDFTSYDATVALNRALLADSYGIRSWNLPQGHLCPAVANRANYLHWIEDLLRLSRPEGCPQRGAAVRGLDVGVGANCVYPLIAASLNGWSFVGADITDSAIDAARANVVENPSVAGLIEIRDCRQSPREDHREGEGEDEVDNGGGVLLPAIRADEQFAFCMCNPPFFETMAEAEQNPSTDFGGTEAEMCCEGGEDAFTRRIYADSLRLRERVHWYTTMCGKKDTMKRLRRLLEVRRVPAVRTATFHQGRTTRWGVAWSFARDAAATTRAPIRADAVVAAATAAKPRWRITFEVQSARSSPGDFMRELREALTREGCAARLDPKDPMRTTCDARKGVLTPAFSATVMRPAPGSLMVDAKCDDGARTSEDGQRKFAAVVAAVRSALALGNATRR